ncbi:hypothetical protein LCGC14_0712710 [marine sediment metagenome]|uniref:Terminase small subunit n=1 Tax=marine sediment metagenome TaxID=412755 RepID=A0A0F9QEM8_9ZZZZ
MGHSESTQNAYPDKISSRHRALMRRLVAGMTISQACEDLGYTVARASVIVNSPLFKEEMKKMEQEVKSGFVDAEAGRLTTDPTKLELDDAKVMAAKTLKGALSDMSGNVRVNAAKDILDRTGYAKEDKVRANVVIEPSQGLLDMLGRVMGGKGGDGSDKANK